MSPIFRSPIRRFRGAPTREQQVNRFTLQQYWQVIWHFKRYAIPLALSSIVTTVCVGAFLPFTLAHAIELVSDRTPMAWGGELSSTLLLALVLAIVAACSHFNGVWMFAKLDGQAQSYLREKIFNRLVHESASFYANAMSGSLMSNSVMYVNGYIAVQEIVLIKGINLFVPLAVGIGIAASQSLLLGEVFLLIACAVGYKTLMDSRYRRPFRRARKEAMSRLNGFIADVITNNAGVRAQAGERHELQTLALKQKIWKKAHYANLVHFGKHNALLLGTMNVLQVGAISVAAWLVTTDQIGLGLIVFAITYFQRLSASLFDLGPTVQMYQGAMTDSASITEILMTELAVTDRPQATQLAVAKGEIDISKATYRYEIDGELVLRDLSLHIPAGQRVGLVGRSGGGKSTLTSLVLRFDDLEDGVIEIDGQDIRAVSQRSLRQAISYVPQDSQLFHRSLRENIAYGRPDASDEEIMQAAKKAHIWEFIISLPEGLETTVGERGLKLSGGQRQRVAIARAILKDAPILVFDEATSALDSESEKYIQDSLERLMKGRTSIVIAHRLSTIQKMDRIVVLEHGQIVEDGTHAALLRKKGIYATLWAHQSGGFIEGI